MKVAFMSSVLPRATLAELLAAGASHGYEGLEFRPEWKHAHGIELDASADQRAEAAKRLADSAIEPCCLSPGVRFNRDDPGERDESVHPLRIRGRELQGEYLGFPAQSVCRNNPPQ